ncbi:MAG: hypothetical protein U0Y96_04245 [Candidatus Kapaibacterium sp.]
MYSAIAGLHRTLHKTQTPLAEQNLLQAEYFYHDRWCIDAEELSGTMLLL